MMLYQHISGRNLAGSDDRLTAKIEQELKILFSFCRQFAVQSRFCPLSVIFDNVDSSLPTSSNIKDFVKFVAFLPSQIYSILC